MEAARVARLRGHNVTLFEKRKLGGVLNEGSAGEFKADLRFLITNMIHQIKSAGVRIVMEKAISDRLAGGNFDIVILATGGGSSLPDIPGLTSERVVDAIDIFDKPDQVGKEVVVLGGGETAVEAALYLADQGRRVTLLHRRDLMAEDCVITDKIAYLELLVQKQVTIMLPYQVTAIDGRILTAAHRQTGETISLEADHFVTALGYRPAQTGLAQALCGQTGIDVYEIGDGARTAKVLDGIHAGFKLARRL